MRTSTRDVVTRTVGVIGAESARFLPIDDTGVNAGVHHIRDHDRGSTPRTRAFAIKPVLEGEVQVGHLPFREARA